MQPDRGTFTLSSGGITSRPMPWNASSEEIAAELTRIRPRQSQEWEIDRMGRIEEMITRLWWRWSARFMYDSDALIDLMLITIATLVIGIAAIAVLWPLLLQLIASSVSIT